jgi:hypothetical protein
MTESKELLEMFRFRRRATPTPAPSSVVADECESFLAGEYIDRLLDLDREVPSWAWINAIAHAAPSRIVELASEPSSPPSMRADYRAWRMVIREIAEDVLATAMDTSATVEEIQSLTLMPIEFALMSNPIGPRTTLRVVEHALKRTAQ